MNKKELKAALTQVLKPGGYAIMLEPEGEEFPCEDIWILGESEGRFYVLPVPIYNSDGVSEFDIHIRWLTKPRVSVGRIDFIGGRPGWKGETMAFINLLAFVPDPNQRNPEYAQMIPAFIQDRDENLDDYLVYLTRLRKAATRMYEEGV
jgi:hypothetical protein